jgi:hypothetical protein
VARLVIAIAPFADEPYTIAAARFVTIFSRWDDASERKPCGQWHGGAFTPGVAAKRVLLGQLHGEVTRG